MKKFEKTKYFILGMLLTVVIFNFASPAFAALATKTIQVATGVNIYIDDVKLDPKDASGNPVEPFVYNGTTYLPVRAIGEAYGKVVQWDGSTSSVYVGKHDSSEPAILLQDLDWFTGEDFHTETTINDNLGNTQYNCINCHLQSYPGSGGTYARTNVYKINGQYSKISGAFFLAYDNRNDDSDHTLEIYGDNKLLYTATMTSGIEPIDFIVELTGVLELKIYFDGGNGCTAISNCGLYT